MFTSKLKEGATCSFLGRAPPTEGEAPRDVQISADIRLQVSSRNTSSAPPQLFTFVHYNVLEPWREDVLLTPRMTRTASVDINGY